METIHLHNTLTRKRELFKPLQKGTVKFYSCGPTVYNYAHLGNLRTYIFNDILKRVLLYNGYKVTHVMNITDVDDKTIRGSQEQKLSLKEFTEKYETIFMKDIESLNILLPDKKPRATEHVKEMCALIDALLKNEHAYNADDGIYYDVSKFKTYGKLAHLQKASLQSTGRVKNDSYDKEQARDFALWKFWQEKDGDAAWEYTEGKGRPGWHIECSAMAMKYLGNHFDIHTGAIDLIFPHHENEIAQSEAASGEKFVNYWLHAGFLIMPEGKMSKSIGNIVTLQALCEKGFSPLDYRYFCLTTHYRSELIFSLENMQNAKNSHESVRNKLRELKRNSGKKDVRESVCDTYTKKFTALVNDDLDMPKALAFFHTMLKDEKLSEDEKYKLTLDFDAVFGLNLGKEETLAVPEQVQKLLEEREQARKEKNWKKADEMRKKIQDAGYTIDDTQNGPELRKL